ncbi:MAG TPA: hypothetical protein VHS31_06900 [Tepidisphaeraceae bacterium]|nr:hypothetical protein [Tepidisphaeraceae bacterium]
MEYARSRSSVSGQEEQGRWSKGDFAGVTAGWGLGVLQQSRCGNFAAAELNCPIDMPQQHQMLT